MCVYNKIPRTKQLYKKETCLKFTVLDVGRNDIISQVLMANGNITRQETKDQAEEVSLATSHTSHTALPLKGPIAA